jgi:group I intron endonuclease
MKKLSTSVPGIYIITCIPTGKVYVGQSKNCTQRWGSHRWHLGRKTHRNYRLQWAWNEYGKDAFSFEIAELVEDGNPAELARLEIEVMQRYPDPFNLMESEDVRLTPSDETRAKLSAERKARWADPEYRARLKASHAKRNADPEYRERHRAAMLAFNATPEGRAIRSKVANDTWAKEGSRERRSEKSKAHWGDPEHRAKQEAARKASWADEGSRKVRLDGLKRGWSDITPEQRERRIEAARAGRERAYEERKRNKQKEAPQLELPGLLDTPKGKKP